MNQYWLFPGRNYSSAAGLEAEGTLLDIRKKDGYGPSTPTFVHRKSISDFILDKCSGYVPLLIELDRVASEKNIPFWVCFSSVFNFPSRQMSEVKWREKPKLVTGCKSAHGQQTAMGIGEGMSVNGCRIPAPKVKLPF